MERAVIKSILANAELSDDAKLEQIMNLNGADITREKDAAKQLKADLEHSEQTLSCVLLSQPKLSDVLLIYA